MTPAQHTNVLAVEQAMSRRYMERLEERLSKPIHYGTTRNEKWLKGHPQLGRDLSIIGPLVGRVGLDDTAPDLGTSFYVGPMHGRVDGHEVYCWHAPTVSKLFYQPDSDDTAAGAVVTRRTFVAANDELVDYRDEHVAGTPHPDPFPISAPVLPDAPASSARRRMASEAVETPGIVPTPASEPEINPAPEPDTEPESLPEGEPTFATKVEPASDSAEGPASSQPSTVPEQLLQGMRAVDVVLDRLASPRGERLTSVLSTLQPDQHELALAPADESMIIQGHPGTGKTIIAVHRAAFLASDEEDGPALRRVLLVGPTDGYVRHIIGMLAPLADLDKVRVASLEELMLEVRGMKSSVGGALDGRYDASDERAGGLAQRAKAMLDARGGFASGKDVRTANLKKLYEFLRANGDSAERISGNREIQKWLEDLPSFEQVSNRRRYLPLLARCALAIQPVPSTDRFEHVVVDEAQDVTQIEWSVLEQFLRPRGDWTLVGDMNQRRSDATYMSWMQIADHLALGTEEQPIEPVVIERGYRSTSAILKFADKLLPAGQRGALTLQTNGAPVGGLLVRAKGPEALHAKAVDVATQLGDKYAAGTVAVLTVDPHGSYTALFSAGWRRVANSQELFAKGDRQLRIYSPEHARGLEFDAVVVVEPLAFPENLGRAGQLYTSLTRANRELHVVYQAGLPDALRRAFKAL
jgi:DNA helicase-2/ATP-dependent DNA helicase PcrA